MYIKSLKIDKNSLSPLNHDGDFNSSAAPEKPQATLELYTKKKAGSWMKNIQIILLTLKRLHSISTTKRSRYVASVESFQDPTVHCCNWMAQGKFPAFLATLHQALK